MEFAPEHPRAKFRLIESESIADEMCAKLAHMHDFYVALLEQCEELKSKKRKGEADTIRVFITMIEENFGEYLKRPGAN